MDSKEITKRFNSAGKSLKQAGIAFSLIPVVALIFEAITSQMDIKNIEDIKNIAIASKLIYSLLCIFIASCLISAGKGLIGLYPRINEHKKSMKDPKEIKEQTIKIGQLEIITEDLGEMNWEDAKRCCADLGDGWRLPTKDELNLLYENKDEIGGFANSFYWSSTEKDYGVAWEQNFFNGYQNDSIKNVFNYVRAVRAF